MDALQEPASASTSALEGSSPAEGLPPGSPGPTPLSSTFGRTTWALAELGRALVAFSEALAEDVAGVLRPAAAQIQNTAGGVLHRAAHLNQANFKLAALRFAKLLSDFAWRSAKQVQRLKVADIARKLRWRPMTWRAVIFTTLAVGMISAGAFAWALSEVPWKQIAEGTLKPLRN